MHAPSRAPFLLPSSCQGIELLPFVSNQAQLQMHIDAADRVYSIACKFFEPPRISTAPLFSLVERLSPPPPSRYCRQNERPLPDSTRQTCPRTILLSALSWLWLMSLTANLRRCTYLTFDNATSGLSWLLLCLRTPSRSDF